MATPGNTGTPPIIRMAHPLAFAAFMRHIGAPVERHLRRQGLPTLCNDPSDFVPLRRAWSFFDATAQAEDPMLGWHVGRYVGDHNLNDKLLHQLESKPSLYQALQHLVRMISSEASHLQIGILERDRDILFYTHYPGRRAEPGYMTSQAYQLGVYLDFMRHFLGRHWVPPEMGIEYPTVPPVAESHFPGSRILASQEMGYIAVPRSCLHMRVENTGGAKQNDLILAKDFDWVKTLRTLLKSYMADGYVTKQSSASLLGTSVRTLTRRLSEQGLTYGSLMDEVRFDAAKDMLQTPGMRVMDVARAVGFEDHSDFTRMFHRVGGLTPREFSQASRSS